MAETPGRVTETAISIIPANEASWDDLQAVFGGCSGGEGTASQCQCQRFRLRSREWYFSQRWVPAEERAELLREQTACGNPGAHTTSGIVAYLDSEPVGWCAVEPRTTYVRLLTSRVPWAGRAEDQTDPSVWAATCFITRKDFRRRGITYALARGAVDFAQARGARALEGYPMITYPGQEVTWGELHVGSRSIFEAAGFQEISRPTARRVVMRIDF